jgi:hypothetical protein
MIAGGAGRFFGVHVSGQSATRQTSLTRKKLMLKYAVVISNSPMAPHAPCVRGERSRVRGAVQKPSRDGPCGRIGREIDVVSDEIAAR